MIVRYYERQIGDKIYYLARTCETKEEAIQKAKQLRAKGYKARIYPVKFYSSNEFQIYLHPKEENHFRGGLTNE